MSFISKKKRPVTTDGAATLVADSKDKAKESLYGLIPVGKQMITCV